jgi:hypothetical protein
VDVSLCIGFEETVGTHFLHVSRNIFGKVTVFLMINVSFWFALSSGCD